MKQGAKQSARQLTKQLEATLDELEREPDPIVRAQEAHRVCEMMREYAEQYGWQRTAAFVELRERMGYSLADLAAEFSVSRARAAQIAVRDRYNDQKRARKEANGA